MTNHIVSLLEEYPDTMRKIALLRYEVEHPAPIKFGKKIIEGASADGKSADESLNYAIRFHNEANLVSIKDIEDITSVLIPMEQDRDRLLHYISLLEERQQIPLKLHYFKRLSWDKIEEEVCTSPKTLRKLVKQAVDSLAEMYAFAASFNRSAEEQSNNPDNSPQPP